MQRVKKHIIINVYYGIIVSSHIAAIGTIYSAIWPCHYQCVLQPSASWSTETADEAIVFKAILRTLTTSSSDQSPLYPFNLPLETTIFSYYSFYKVYYLTIFTSFKNRDYELVPILRNKCCRFNPFFLHNLFMKKLEVAYT